MTYKNREVQPELFTKINKKPKQNLLDKNIFCSHYKSAISVSLDTLIVIIIGMLMINLSSFVLGIERGKVVAKKELAKLDCPAVKGNAAVPVKQKKTKIVVQEEAVKKQEKTAEQRESQPVEQIQVAKKASVGNPTTGYIIQLVTYSNNNNANKEVSRLKSQGHKGHVLKSGEYFVVYSGLYNSKNKAKEQMADFKKRYKDCFVRFLKNS